MMTGVSFEFLGHKIEVDQKIFFATLYIDGKLADKIKGLKKVHCGTSVLKGVLIGDDGKQMEIVTYLVNGPITTEVTLFCDGKKIDTKHMI